MNKAASYYEGRGNGEYLAWIIAEVLQLLSLLPTPSSHTTLSTKRQS